MENDSDFGVRRRVAALTNPEILITVKDWPHAPVHRLDESGIYMVTAGTYQKKHFFNTPDRLEMFMSILFECTQEFGWQLRAWSILINHYHFIARSPDDSGTLRRLLGKLHMTSSKFINELDKTPGRNVWFQYWDSRITYERSYLARLNYVNQNPVKHGVVTDAAAYRWCSSAWFERVSEPSFIKTVKSFKIDRVRVQDDF
jgi:putative transposase